jgi:hypothetical protein
LDDWVAILIVAVLVLGLVAFRRKWKPARTGAPKGTASRGAEAETRPQPTPDLGLPLPQSLLEFIAAGRWPKGHFPVANLNLGPAEPPGWKGMEIDLHSDTGAPPPHEADIGTLIGFAQAPRLATLLKLTRGSENDQAQLPWLDLDKAVCIGLGAHPGDDTWVVLDERTDPPRVLANRHVLPTGPGAQRPTDYEWFVLAPTWQAFFEALTGKPAAL